MTHRHKWPSMAGGLILACTALSAATFGGTVATDGSLGVPAGAIAPGPGNVFPITPASGLQRGQNLFFSFSTFNLNQGDVAAFTGPASGVANVLTRVTGGPSSIDGTIRCTIPQANFYLINPAGVVFGPDAVLDVQGSFAVTTADFVRLADGTQFNASLAQTPVLTTAGPAAFGFLAAHPASLTMQGTALTAPAGKSLSIVGGNVLISGGDLTTSNGRINIVSAGGPGEATLDATAISSPPAPQLGGAGGSVTLQNSSVNANEGGSAIIRASDLTLTGSSVTNLGFVDPGGGIDIALTGNLTLGGSSIFTRSLGSAAGGDISVAAANISLGPDGLIAALVDSTGSGGSINVTASGNLLIDGRGAVATTDTRISAETSAAGAAGNVTVTARSIQIFNTGEIDSTTFSSGAGGRVQITTPGALTIDGRSAPLATDTGVIAEAEGTGAGGSVQIAAGAIALTGNPSDAIGHTEIDTSSFAAGSAGTLSLNSQSLQVVNNARVAADANSTGAGGSISIHSANITLDGGPVLSSIPSTGIDTTTAGAGNGGVISIDASTLEILNGAEVSAKAKSTGSGGSISIIASSSISIDQPNGAFAITGVDSGATGGAGGGAGGNIFVQTPSLQIRAGGSISAEAGSSARGGNVTINAGAISLTGAGLANPQQILSIKALSPSGEVENLPIADTTLIDTAANGFNGSAGDIHITANSLSIVDDAYISASSFDQGACGNIDLNVNSLSLSQAGSPFGTGIFGSSLAPVGGNGGNISIRSNHVSVQDGALISADTFGTGQGGDIVVRAADVSLAGAGAGHLSGIFAQTNAPDSAGAGGSVTIEANTLNMANGAIVSASSLGAGNAGDVSVVTGSAHLSRGSLIAGLADGTGNAGDVSVRSRRNMVFHGGGVQTAADTSSGGNLTLDAGTTIDALSKALISAKSGGNGGNILVIASGRVQLLRSFLTAEAGGAGGHVTFDSQSLTLDRSTIDARAASQPQNVGLHTDVFLLSDSRILTSTGQSFPETQIAGSLAPLAASLDNGYGLIPSCMQGEASSFVVTGSGGMPVEPGSWFPDLTLSPSPSPPK